MRLEIKNLCKTYKKGVVKALDDFSVTLRALLFGYKIKYSYRLKSISKEIGFFYLAKSD